GYTVSYETSSNTVTIINTADDSTEETTTSSVNQTQPVTPPDSTVPGGTTLPGETALPSQDGTTTPDKPDNETTTKPDELIDTGQLNWPVPVLAIAGLLAFSIGWTMLNLGKKETE
ncbi:MAG: hypothetical protein IJE63_04175, partial [Clostridia bacterium]|nr:hypothetical protein [Clostridia bacterium]